MGSDRVQLCGGLVVSIGGERRERALPGRQGRMAFAYLMLHQGRFVGRDELQHAVWPHEAPGAADAGISAIVSKLRKVVPIETGVGWRVALDDALCDVAQAFEAIERAEALLAREDWTAVYGPAHVGMYIAERPFMAEHEAPWIDATRRRLDGVLVCSLECLAAIGPRIGGSLRRMGEHAAQRLTELEPTRETGWRLLMEALEAQGNRAQALQAYERCRCVLRDEVGTVPGCELQQVHERLLQAGVT